MGLGTMFSYDKHIPAVDKIYKQRNRLNQERNDIQNNIKNSIHETYEQIKKLKDKIKVLETKKKTFIIEYNKECEEEDKIRGATPNLKEINTINTINIQESPKSRSKHIENNKFIRVMEGILKKNTHEMENRMNQIEKNLRRKEHSNICTIM